MSRYYSCNELITDVKRLKAQIDRPIDTIVAIARGGLTLAHLLSELMGIRHTFCINTIGYKGRQKLGSVEVFNLPDLSDSKHILIVDDIVDSGDTLIEVLATLMDRYEQRYFYTAALFYKPTASIKPNWYLYEASDDWIEFFWEADAKNTS